MPNKLSPQRANSQLNCDLFARSCALISNRQRIVHNISVCVLAVSALLLVGCETGLSTGPTSPLPQASPSPFPSPSPSPSPSPTPNPDPSPSPTPPPSTVCNGTGLAAEDLAGQCRASPTTMGALEVDGAAGVSVASLALPQTASRSLQVSWPLGKNTIGDMVYFGTTADIANVFVSDLATASGLFYPQAPAVTYDPARDLGLYAGDTACFRIFVYDTARAPVGQASLGCSAV